MAIATNIPQRQRLKTGFVVQGHICVFVFRGECGCICMLSICVADNQLWLLWLNDSYQYECWSAIMDFMTHICMIIICITTHQRVITDYYQQSVWMSGHISV